MVLWHGYRKEKGLNYINDILSANSSTKNYIYDNGINIIGFPATMQEANLLMQQELNKLNFKSYYQICNMLVDTPDEIDYEIDYGSYTKFFRLIGERPVDL